MFVDELTIVAKAGNGGDGVVRWLREQHRPNGGPAGGNGGKGGDVFVRAIRNFNILSKYTGEKLFKAENGAPGQGRSKAGRDGEDHIIDLPIGATVTDLDRSRTYVLAHEGAVIRILKGGQGGWGNEHFKSSVNRSPEEATKGARGEESTFRIEVSLVADVGLIGLPNAGKSTLLNVFTNATSAIGAYPFTTLEPHLGDLYGFAIADIPGLIEGASDGKGLGHKFLRHVSRTKMLLHLVSLEDADAAYEHYQTIRNELMKFDEHLTKKEEWIVLTKSDVVSSEVAEAVKQSLSPTHNPLFVISATSGEGLKQLRDALVDHLRTIKNDV